MTTETSPSEITVAPSTPLNSVGAASPCQTSCGINSRRSGRYSYQRRINFELQCGAESLSLTGQSNDLSRDGISLVISQLVSENTNCRVRLVNESGALQIVDGTVARCISLERTPPAYEVGVRFSSPIDIQQFCPDAVSVQVLVLDNDDLQRKLIARLLAQSGAVAHFCESADEAIQKALSTPYELIIANFDAAELEPCRIVRELRAKRYLRPIISVSCYDLAQVKHSCTSSKCESCRPIELDWTVLSGISQALRIEPITSSLPPTRETMFLVNKFVFSLQERVQEMERAFAENDAGRSAGLARKLAMFAESCGFEPISRTATALSAEIHTAQATAPFREKLNELVRLCLSARPSMAVDATQAENSSTAAD